jgi:hypothetical protein
MFVLLNESYIHFMAPNEIFSELIIDYCHSLSTENINLRSNLENNKFDKNINKMNHPFA